MLKCLFSNKNKKKNTYRDSTYHDPDFDKLTDNQKRKVSLISMFCTDSHYCRCHYRDSSYRSHFWFITIRSKIERANYRSVLPRCIYNIFKLFPVWTSADTDSKVNYSDISGIPSDKILFLIKRLKKTYFKREDLIEMGKFIIACLSGTDIEYVYFGKIDKRDSVIKEANFLTKGDIRNYNIKLYQKEIDALEESGLICINRDLVTASASHTDEYTVAIPPYTGENDIHCIEKHSYDYSGFLFKIPQISIEEAENLYSEIRNNRLKELHIDYVCD